MPLAISRADSIEADAVSALYRALAWSPADKPGFLLAALRHSHSLVTTRQGGVLVGLPGR